MEYIRTICELAGLELDFPEGVTAFEFAMFCSAVMPKGSACVYLHRLFKWNYASRSKDLSSKVTKTPYRYRLSRRGKSYLLYLARKPRKGMLDAFGSVSVKERAQVFPCALEALLKKGRYEEVEHLYAYYKERTPSIDPSIGSALRDAKEICSRALTEARREGLANMSSGVSTQDLYHFLRDEMVLPEVVARQFTCRFFSQGEMERILSSDEVRMKPSGKTEPPKATREDSFIEDLKKHERERKKIMMLQMVNQLGQYA